MEGRDVWVVRVATALAIALLTFGAKEIRDTRLMVEKLSTKAERWDNHEERLDSIEKDRWTQDDQRKFEVLVNEKLSQIHTEIARLRRDVGMNER